MSLAPLSSNLGVSRAKHLLRRACFHYNKDLLYTISGLNVDQAIDYLLQDNTVSYEEPYDPLPSDSPHGYWLSSNEYPCLLYTSPSPRDLSTSRMPSSA